MACVNAPEGWGVPMTRMRRADEVGARRMADAVGNDRLRGGNDQRTRPMRPSPDITPLLAAKYGGNGREDWGGWAGVESRNSDRSSDPTLHVRQCACA